MFLGSLMLFEETSMPTFSVDWRVALVIAIASGLFFFFAMGMAFKTRIKKPTTGVEGLVNEIGIALTNLDPEGDIKVHGEFWHAISNESINKGDKVRVVQVDRMTLHVVKSS